MKRAATLYDEALSVLQHIGDTAVAALCLEGMAAVTLAAGALEQAARLFGAAATLRRSVFVLFVWDDRAARDRRIEAVRIALGEAAFAGAWAQGQALTLEQAIALARSASDQH